MKRAYCRLVLVQHWPEKRVEGLCQLQQLAALLIEQGVQTEILASCGADSTQCAVISHYESRSHVAALHRWGRQDAAYQQWLEDVQSCFDWSRTVTRLFTIG